MNAPSMEFKMYSLNMFLIWPVTEHKHMYRYTLSLVNVLPMTSEITYDYIVT